MNIQFMHKAISSKAVISSPQSIKDINIQTQTFINNFDQQKQNFNILNALSSSGTNIFDHKTLNYQESIRKNNQNQIKQSELKVDCIKCETNQFQLRKKLILQQFQLKQTFKKQKDQIKRNEIKKQNQFYEKITQLSRQNHILQVKNQSYQQQKALQYEKQKKFRKQQQNNLKQIKSQHQQQKKQLIKQLTQKNQKKQHSEVQIKYSHDQKIKSYEKQIDQLKQQMIKIQTEYKLKQTNNKIDIQQQIKRLKSYFYQLNDLLKKKYQENVQVLQKQFSLKQRFYQDEIFMIKSMFLSFKQQTKIVKSNKFNNSQNTIDDQSSSQQYLFIQRSTQIAKLNISYINELKTQFESKFTQTNELLKSLYDNQLLFLKDKIKTIQLKNNQLQQMLLVLSQQKVHILNLKSKQIQYDTLNKKKLQHNKIQIHEDKISILEGTINNLQKQLKFKTNQLSLYQQIISSKDKQIDQIKLTQQIEQQKLQKFYGIQKNLFNQQKQEQQKKNLQLKSIIAANISKIIELQQKIQNYQDKSQLIYKLDQINIKQIELNKQAETIRLLKVKNQTIKQKFDNQLVRLDQSKRQQINKQQKIYQQKLIETQNQILIHNQQIISNLKLHYNGHIYALSKKIEELNISIQVMSMKNYQLTIKNDILERRIYSIENNLSQIMHYLMDSQVISDRINQ